MRLPGVVGEVNSEHLTDLMKAKRKTFVKDVSVGDTDHHNIKYYIK